MSPPWSLRVEPDPDLSLRDQIVAPLGRYNEDQVGPSNWRLYVITLRVVGGLWGRMAYRYLFVELLATGPARGQGIGRQLMEMAEAQARAQGLLGMWLDTWTFQAPSFYQKLGFEECGRIKDYPPGHDRIFFVKRFGANGSAA